jgi:NAD(P)H-dependent FMN reductase
MLRTAIIIGSIRPGRKAESVARWIHQVASVRGDSEFGLVDLQSFGLPFDEEPGLATLRTSRRPATLAWAETIDSHDAFVFVTPEYNHGTSSALRNAIGLLTRPWNNKAAGFVSYGSALGRRAVDQLRTLLGDLHVADVGAHVTFSLFNDFENFGEFRPAARYLAEVNAMLDQVIAWGGAMKALRQPAALAS